MQDSYRIVDLEHLLDDLVTKVDASTESINLIASAVASSIETLKDNVSILDSNDSILEDNISKVRSRVSDVETTLSGDWFSASLESRIDAAESNITTLFDAVNDHELYGDHHYHY